VPDPSDLIEQYQDECALLAAEEEAFLADTIPVQADDSGEPPDTSFIESCLLNNERGDGILYTRLLRDQFIYVKGREKKPWLCWDGHHWKVDSMGLHIRAVEKVALLYKDAAFALDEPIGKESAKQREAEKLASIAEASGDMEEKAEHEAVARSHAHQVKLLRSKKDKFLRRVDRLRGKGGAEKTTWWAHHVERPLAIEGDELDEQRMQLAAPNGVIDLYSGDLLPGRPRDYNLKSIAVPYPEDIDRKRIMRYLDTGKGIPELDPWVRFTTQILSHSPDGSNDGSGVPEFFHKLAGYATMGEKKHHMFVIATGGGRNGKGTFFRTTRSILGDFYWTIKSDLLLDSKQVRNTAGPSPEIMAMRYRRIVVASETDQHKYIAAAAVKEYSGGDDLNARSLFDEEINYIPSHILWMQTNHVPAGVLKDFALRQRAVILDLPWRYVYDIPAAIKKEPHLAPWFRQVDPDLEKQFQAMRSLILLWYLRGAILMQREGPNIPARVKAEMDERQLQEDHIEQHLRTCCLLDWDPDREYGEGDQVNLPDPDGHIGQVFTSVTWDNRGNHPLNAGGSDAWEYVGRSGIDPAGHTYYREYYGHYIKWFAENINDKRDKQPSTKSVADALRKKGFDVRAVGGQTKIFNGGIKVIGGITA
jgi:putative DNA primase/helicase